MTHIFVLNSYPTAGKDSFVDMISARHEGIFKMSSVDLVKQVARVAGWDGTKTSKNRKFLSDLKDLLTEWNDVPYYDIENRIKEIEFYNKDDKPILIFVMVREPKEIQKMVDICYEHLMSPEWKPGEFYITMLGDTLVFGIKFEDEVNVYITRDYWEDSTCL